MKYYHKSYIWFLQLMNISQCLNRNATKTRHDQVAEGEFLIEGDHFNSCQYRAMKQTAKQ